jgi:predicted RNA-binding Zn-ribbon protein involved in translation (DUF1610 family)
MKRTNICHIHSLTYVGVCPECRDAKLKAIHCLKCGILTGYRRYDVDILCVNCGQDILSEKGN